MTGAKRFCKIVEWGPEIKKIGNQLVKRSPLLIVDVAETCFQNSGPRRTDEWSKNYVNVEILHF